LDGLPRFLVNHSRTNVAATLFVDESKTGILAERGTPSFATRNARITIRKAVFTLCEICHTLVRTGIYGGSTFAAIRPGRIIASTRSANGAEHGIDAAFVADQLRIVTFVAPGTSEDAVTLAAKAIAASFFNFFDAKTLDFWKAQRVGTRDRTSKLESV
jgi:hypothetical protein